MALDLLDSLGYSQNRSTAREVGMSPETASLIARAQEAIAAAREIHRWREAAFAFAREQRELIKEAKAGTTAHTAHNERQDAATAPGG